MSSSAAPPPPSSSSGASTVLQNGFMTYGAEGISSANRSNGAGGGGNQDKPFAHLQDLISSSTEGLNGNHSIPALLETARQSLRTAETMLEYRKPDLAYKEYLKAAEIVLNLIPSNLAFPDFKTRGHGWPLYQQLLKSVAAQDERFRKIRDIIKNDNQRKGTQPRLPNSLLPGPQRPSTPSTRPNGTTPQQNADDHPSSIQHKSVGAVNELGASPHRTPPSVSPKPQALHGNAINTNGSTDALKERFARLGVRGPPVETSDLSKRANSRASYTSSNGSPVNMVSPTDYNGRSSFDMLSPVKSNSSLSHLTGMRPGGPRAMPNGAPVMPLDTQLAAAMPAPPSAVYSPARNMQVTGNIQPPRSTARSMVGTGGRSNSVASSASSIAPGTDSEAAGYFPKMTANGPPSRPASGAPRRKSVHLPKEIRIGPEKLYDYNKMHNILIIDVRSREEFDQGHIYAQSIMCIEPTALRKDMSADELQDSLVLSPEDEQAMFFSRQDYDLVVFYDQSTSEDRFLTRPSTDQDYALRYLHDALYEYNHDKPLQRPPILLMGGIEAWANLVGTQALKTSNTVTKIKGARPIRRVPVANGARRLHVSKRRLRDYNPLDAEEERKWLERARSESVKVDQKQSSEDDDESAQVEDASPFYQNIEEFLRRFPDAGSVEPQQSMVRPPSRPPPAAPQIPSYPTPPPPSGLPSVPSRPAPAAPRMSYSGVNERAPSHGSQRSADLPVYVPPRYMPKNIRLPRTGLVNFGVTCYMNATIQALSATTPLTMFFLDDKFRNFIQRENWKGSKGVLPELYHNLMASIWKGDVAAIRPTTLRSFCARLNREWGIDRQQDAKEFFDFLIDCLHEDLNANWQRSPLRALTEQEEAKRESMPKLIVSRTEWSRYLHREQSFLTDTFAGQHASRLRCTTCHFTSTTYEAFYSISVEIPRSGQGTIQECLRSYCAEEMLSGDEVWKCPRCKVEREATKQITITRAPQFLVVHFKRFSAGHEGAAKKVRTPIDFPIKGFDLEPYMLPQPSRQEGEMIAKQYGADALKTGPEMTPPYQYDCYAVMRHIGTTLTSGHYISLVRDQARNCWRQFNDTWVSDFDPERLSEKEKLQNEMAYIVFYQRKVDR